MIHFAGATGDYSGWPPIGTTLDQWLTDRLRPLCSFDHHQFVRCRRDTSQTNANRCKCYTRMGIAINIPSLTVFAILLKNAEVSLRSEGAICLPFVLGSRKAVSIRRRRPRVWPTGHTRRPPIRSDA